MTYADAMRRYGIDKPDLRFGLELVDLTEYFAGTPFRVFQAPYVGAVVMPGGASQPRSSFDGWQDWAKSRGARAWPTCCRRGRHARRPGREEPVRGRARWPGRATGAKPGDCIFFAAGRSTDGSRAARRGPAGDRPSAAG